jgi:hypothetical protein
MNSKLLTAGWPQGTDSRGTPPTQQAAGALDSGACVAAAEDRPTGDRSTRAVQLLEELVAHRSLHLDWAYSGLDGAMAARALAVLRATESVPFLVRTFLAVDPELKKLVKPPANYSYAWLDYRMKRELICVLGELSCEPSRKFLREYLALDEATAGQSAAPLFEEATRPSSARRSRRKNCKTSCKAPIPPYEAPQFWSVSMRAVPPAMLC